MSARERGRFRDTAMLAMLTSASPRIVPEAADAAGPVVVDDEEHERLEGDLDVVAERAHEPRLVVAAGGRPADDELVVARRRR